jgi:hypothetical protein
VVSIENGNLRMGGLKGDRLNQPIWRKFIMPDQDLVRANLVQTERSWAEVPGESQAIIRREDRNLPISKFDNDSLAYWPVATENVPRMKVVPRNLNRHPLVPDDEHTWLAGGELAVNFRRHGLSSPLVGPKGLEQATSQESGSQGWDYSTAA